jgi:hypothetical protein
MARRIVTPVKPVLNSEGGVDYAATREAFLKANPEATSTAAPKGLAPLASKATELDNAIKAIIVSVCKSETEKLSARERQALRAMAMTD